MCQLCIPSSLSLPFQVAPPGDGRHTEALSDSFGPERAHTLSSWHQHRMLPHLWGLLLRLCACCGRRNDTWDMCDRAQFSTTSAQSRRSTLHLHQWLERATSHFREGEGVKPGAEGGPKEKAAGVVRQLPSADEGAVHWSHWGDGLQKWLIKVFFSTHKWVNFRYYDHLFCSLWRCVLLLCGDLDDAVSVIYMCRLL